MEAIGAEAAKLAGLQIDLLQKLRAGQITLAQFQWYLGLKSEERYALMEGKAWQSKVVIDLPPAFIELPSFELAVLADYEHKGYLGRFRVAHKKELRYGMNPAMTDWNYGNPSHVLKAGERFLIRQFALTRRVESPECLALYREHKAHLTGAHGAAILYDTSRLRLPIGKWSLSFDEEDCLWDVAYGYYGVPFVGRYSGGGFGLGLGRFGSPWDGGCVLSLFCDFPPEAGSQLLGT